MSGTDADEIDLRMVVQRLLVGRWWIVGSVILFTAAFTAYAFLTPKIYRSSTVMVSATTERSSLAESLGGALGSLGGLASLAGINVASAGLETEEALAVLRSRQFTEAFINDKGLIPKLFPKAWDAGKRRWKPDVVPPTPARAFKYFDKSIRTVAHDKRTGLITLSIEWRDRNEAAQWANELVQRLNAEMRARAIAKAAASLKYLEKELETTSIVGTRDAINRIVEAQVKQRMLANVTEEYVFRVVDRAMSPDATDHVRPKKLVLLVAGPAIGFFVGAGGVLVLGWFLSVLGLRRAA